MRTSVHLVDGSARSAFRMARRGLSPADTPGLLGARVLIAAPLSGAFLSRPQLRRLGLVAFWKDDEAIDRFEREHPLTEMLTDGWCTRLEPQRAVAVVDGHFPGVPDDVPGRDTAGHDGPAAVLTIGRLRLRRAVPFLRTSARAEAEIAHASGLLWATGLANVTQGVVSTFSLWESADALRCYATATTGHKEAMRRQERRSFHHAGSFIRFRPYATRGSLRRRRNPLPEAISARLRASA